MFGFVVVVIIDVVADEDDYISDVVAVVVGLNLLMVWFVLHLD